jgi:hypothetical protein
MKNTQTKLLFMPFWVIFAAFIFAACSTEQFDDLEAEDVELKKASATQNKILAEIKSATAKYHDLDAAIADGYQLDPHCVEHPVLGAMGHHAVNWSRIGPAVVPSEPGVLVYEPMKNGKYRLVAVEFLVPADPLDESNADEPPPMLGEVAFDDHRQMTDLLDEFDNPVLDENGEVVQVNAKGGPPFPHYQLHVWVWKNNPNGMYFPFNPNVRCQ